MDKSTSSVVSNNSKSIGVVFVRLFMIYNLFIIVTTDHNNGFALASPSTTAEASAATTTKISITTITQHQQSRPQDVAPSAPSNPVIRNHQTTSQNDGALSEKSIKLSNGSLNKESAADLTPLINETLTINNKTAGSERQSVKDDWTFDMVEYDLMEFLQDLSARYRLANGNRSLEAHPTSSDELESRKQLISTPANKPPSHLASEPLAEAKSVDNNSTGGASSASSASNSTSSSTSGLADAPAVSLAGGDHDIAESTWQYGIFDRFTRPRPSSSSSTTSSPDLTPPDDAASSGSSRNNLVRNYNTEECGLRTYDYDSQYLASPLASQLDDAADQDTESLELKLRRQKPPPSSSFFSSHKKFQGAAPAAGQLDDDLGAAEADRRPPLDSHGEAATPTGGESLSDTEFNLSSRRHWLQQQLGQTLQMLGFNSTSGRSAAAGAPFDSLPADPNSVGGNTRENMMKKSSKTSRGISTITGNNNNKQQVPVGSGTGSGIGLGSVPVSVRSSTDNDDDELTNRQDELKLEARVIGGSDARLGDSPWSVSLQALVSRPGTGGVEYRHYCGGTIISEYYILTAAHCLDFMVGRESRLFVVIGDLNWRMSAASLHGRRFGVDKLIIHAGYKSTAFGHDIGLIRTKDKMGPLKVNGRYIINSVCLPERNVEHSGEAELVGWGLFSNRNEMADSLQIADVPILPRPLCVDLYKRRTGLIQWLIGIELITDKQVCAGTFGRGICQGDSGSALVFNEKVTSRPASTATVQLGAKAAPPRRTHSARDTQTQATIIGTVAFGGIRRCSYQSLPGVYMQTSKYLDWILPRIQS